MMRPPDSVLAFTIAVCAIVLGFLFLFSYLLSKRLVVQVETGSGRFIGVRFKPSIIGELNVNLEEASNAVEIINTLIAAKAQTF
jgi:hypothetical protein